MQLPDKIKARILRSDEGNLLNIIAGTVNELISYLEAKEKAPMQYSGGTISIPAGTLYSETPTCNCSKSNAMCSLHGSVANGHTANFHSETEEMMFRARDIIIREYSHGGYWLDINGKIATYEQAEAAREVLLKLTK